MKHRVLRLRIVLEELTPEQVALLLTVGMVLGVFPIMGCPTFLCVLAALILRQNVAALQLVNQVASPLQLALLLPLSRAGAWLCGSPVPTGSTGSRVGVTALYAIAGWAGICIPISAVLYVILVLAMRRGRPSWFKPANSAGSGRALLDSARMPLNSPGIS